jgi:hypothetical protein
MRQLQRRIWNAGWGEEIAQGTDRPDAQSERSTASPIGALTVAAGSRGLACDLRFIRWPAALSIRSIALFLALLPAGVSFTKYDPVPTQDVSPETVARAMMDDSVAADFVLRLHQWDGRSTRPLNQVPAALRKHSRRPSPSDDDGTSRDPTDADETSDTEILNDDADTAITLSSPPVLSFLVASESVFSSFRPPTATPLFLTQQRFRC